MSRKPSCKIDNFESKKRKGDLTLLDKDWEYVDCKMLSHDRMFWVFRKEANLVKTVLRGAYPENMPSGSDARSILFEETYSDVALYQLMGAKSRERSKKIAAWCKEAITVCNNFPEAPKGPYIYIA